MVHGPAAQRIRPIVSAAFVVFSVTVVAFPGTSVARPKEAPGAANYSQVILADHPIIYWRLGELSGRTAFDSSGHGRDATYKKGPRKGVQGAIVGDADTAVRFDGLDDRAV